MLKIKDEQNIAGRAQRQYRDNAKQVHRHLQVCIDIMVSININSNTVQYRDNAKQVHRHLQVCIDIMVSINIKTTQYTVHLHNLRHHLRPHHGRRHRQQQQQRTMTKQKQ